MPVDPVLLLVAFVVMTIGACIQGVLGFGANLLAVPVLVLMEPAFVPAPVIVAAITLNLLVAHRNRAEHPWRRLRWPLAGQIVGVTAGVALVSLLPRDRLAIAFGVLVLVAVGLSVVGLRPRATPATLVGAGTASGFMGTSVGIGGPPIALVLQGSDGPELRSSLSRFFLVGGTLGLIGLAIAGRFTLPDLVRAAALVPGNLVGFRLSGLLVDRIDRDQLRTGILVVSSLSAVAAIARATLL